MRTKQPPGGGEKPRRFSLWQPTGKSASATTQRLPLWHAVEQRARLVWNTDVHGHQHLHLSGIISMDVGGVLLARHDENNRPLTPPEFHRSVLMKHVLEVVEIMGYFWSPLKLYIVKNETVVGQGDETFDTLVQRHFFSRTHFMPSHYVVVNQRAYKGKWCEENNSDFHIDDYNEVGLGLSASTKFISFSGTFKVYREKDIWKHKLRKRVSAGDLQVEWCRGWLAVLRVLLDSYKDREVLEVVDYMDIERKRRVGELLRNLYRRRWISLAGTPRVLHEIYRMAITSSLNNGD